MTNDGRNSLAICYRLASFLCTGLFLLVLSFLFFLLGS